MSKRKPNLTKSVLVQKNLQRNAFVVAKPRLLVHSTQVKSQFDGRLHRPLLLQKMQTDIRRLLYYKAVMTHPSILASKTSLGSALSRLNYKVHPLRRAICQSRRMRRSVLHALKKTGAGGSRKPSRRTWKSSVKC